MDFVDQNGLNLRRDALSLGVKPRLSQHFGQISVLGGEFGILHR